MGQYAIGGGDGEVGAGLSGTYGRQYGTIRPVKGNAHSASSATKPYIPDEFSLRPPSLLFSA